MTLEKSLIFLGLVPPGSEIVILSIECISVYESFFLLAGCRLEVVGEESLVSGGLWFFFL